MAELEQQYLANYILAGQEITKAERLIHVDENRCMLYVDHDRRYFVACALGLALIGATGGTAAAEKVLDHIRSAYRPYEALADALGVTPGIVEAVATINTWYLSVEPLVTALETGTLEDYAALDP